MRHLVKGRKLGRTTAHRRALLRNLVTSFFEKERIQTTLAKAKEARPFAEKMITLAKKNTLPTRRRALAFLTKESAVTRLFNDIGPRFSERPGGYTRIVKTGLRLGDGSQMALLELIGWIGSALVILSLTQARVLRFRWLNLTGAVLAVLYAPFLFYAGELLESTRLPHSAIAQQCGFDSPETFRVAFRRQLGIAPGAYRQRFSALDRA